MYSICLVLSTLHLVGALWRSVVLSDFVAATYFMVGALFFLHLGIYLEAKDGEL